ncbi:hypothetical protein [Mycoplasmopsis columboralis]|uniref:Uncharacterized protein n=1 Tax=Mycoplasmopsis columboralis TaxID=171282 RepID=A0A449B6U8_9BACT|nr:hypothetical protein [Mycoplasmopsis columboralis]VEU76282.1 Uncharacterised protein [Mycoplasmopsis columboralis]
MELLEIKKLFVYKLSSIPGIVKIQKNENNLTENSQKTEFIDMDNLQTDPIELVEVYSTPNGWSFVAAVSVLSSVAVKPLVEELYSQMYYELRKKKEILNKITILVRGVENV